MLAGCATCPWLAEQTTPSYHPSNVYREQPLLPRTIKRVAVLPLTVPNSEFGTRNSELEFGRETLWPVLLDELGRARQFELVSVSPEELRVLTGRSEWSGEERLPLDFFDRLKDTLGADAVLFCRLTQYRAYEPLTIGWRLKLLDSDELRVFWAVDEVFDARIPEVAAAARRYAKEHPDSTSSVHESHSVLLSPRRFGQYTASAVVETMPTRTAANP